MNYLNSIVISAILLAVSATASGAEDAKTTLADIAKTLGAGNIKTLHYSGAGSSYVVTEGPAPAGGWPHQIMKSYVRDLNFEATSSRVELTRTDGTAGGAQTFSQNIDAGSPWASQYEFWITPFGFLKAAIRENSPIESKTVLGTPYKVVTVTLPGNQKVVGYINDHNLIDKVETWIGDRHVEASYSDYRDFDGVKVPMMITQKHAGELSLILIVNNVRVEQ